jgi:hypothetical protein
MKDHLLIILVFFTLILAGPAYASHWFQVINVTPIVTTPNGEADFTVSVKGLGSERDYVELVFKNESEGLEIGCPKIIKNVYPAGVTEYNCSVKVGNVPPGNYSFVVDVAAKGAPSGKRTAFVNVVPANYQATAEAEQQINENSGSDESALTGSRGADMAEGNQTSGEKEVGQSAEQESHNAPAPGVVTAVIAMLIILRRMNKRN